MAAQEPITIGRDDNGNLVLTQDRWPDDGACIFINRDYEDAFLDRLCDFLGIPSFP